jgi:hypothetical protein
MPPACHLSSSDPPQHPAHSGFLTYCAVVDAVFYPLSTPSVAFDADNALGPRRWQHSRRHLPPNRDDLSVRGSSETSAKRNKKKAHLHVAGGYGERIGVNIV